MKPSALSFAISILFLILAACASQEPILDWITEPAQDGGFAAVQCVPVKRHFHALKAEASAKARWKLKDRFNRRLTWLFKQETYQKAMDPVCQAEKIDCDFCGHRHRFTEFNRLAGIRMVAVDYIDATGSASHLCVRGELKAQLVDEFLDDLYQAHCIALGVSDKTRLREAFSHADHATVLFAPE